VKRDQKPAISVQRCNFYSKFQVEGVAPHQSFLHSRFCVKPHNFVADSFHAGVTAEAVRVKIDKNQQFRSNADTLIHNFRYKKKRSTRVLDLGVHSDEKLSFREHIHATINKAYMMLGIMKHNFKYLTIPTFVLLYNSMVRSHLDYCFSVWAPYKKVDIKALEKCKKATKILPALKRLVLY